MSVFAQANKVSNMSVVSNTKVEKVVGKDFVEGVQVMVDGNEKYFEASAVFVALGRKPKTDIFGKELVLDALGFIKTDENMQTSISGVYAVGDVRAGVMKQIVTACSDGAIAGKKACQGVLRPCESGKVKRGARDAEKRIRAFQRYVSACKKDYEIHRQGLYAFGY